MKLTFLGTSDGVPDAERHCCSILLRAGDNAYLIDGGAPVADLLVRQGIPYRRVKALFNTHVHSDHILGALPFLSLCSWYYPDASVEVYLPEEAACIAIRDMLMLTDGHFDASRVQLRSYDKTFVYDDGTLRLTVVPTRHMAHVGRPSYGFLAEAEGKTIFFTGDMTGDLSDFPSLLYRRPVDLLVTECAHFPVSLLAAGLAGDDTTGPVRAAAVAVIHVAPKAEKFPQLAAVAGTLPFSLLLPCDGEELVL